MQISCNTIYHDLNLCRITESALRSDYFHYNIHECSRETIWSKKRKKWNKITHKTYNFMSLKCNKMSFYIWKMSSYMPIWWGKRKGRRKGKESQNMDIFYSFTTLFIALCALWSASFHVWNEVWTRMWYESGLLRDRRCKQGLISIRFQTETNAVRPDNA